MSIQFPSTLKRSVFASAAVLFAAQAHAGVLFTYNGFSDVSGLTMAGSAAAASTSDGTVLRVTPATGDQSGAAYSKTPIALGAGDTFSTQFQFRFTSPGGIDPADGITFVLAASPTGLGGLGYGMGYQGVGNSTAIEFDTYNNNGYGLPNNDGNSSNHVAIDENGVLSNLALSNVYGNQNCDFSSATPGTANGCMSNGHLWTATISYDGSHLNATVSDPAEGSSFSAISNYAIDLSSLLGTNSAYVGFTGSTGAGWENQDVKDWTFSNSATLPVTTSSPEPGTNLMLGLGLLLLGGFGYRRVRTQMN